MNYKKVYDSIIDRARDREIQCYTERHHILPRCMGGDDSSDNLVRLTAREHYICHWLLARHYNNSSLWFAFRSMNRSSKNQKRYITSRGYEEARIEANKASSRLLKGVKKTKEHCISISKGKKGKPSYHKNRPQPEAKKKQISNTMKGIWKERKKTGFRFEKRKLPYKVECEYCRKSITPQMYSRWHGEKCKNK